jgi:ATP-dependent Lhr-like helicase
MSAFHPAVRDWFSATFAAATPVQLEAWPAIRSAENVLIAAPPAAAKPGCFPARSTTGGAEP